MGDETVTEQGPPGRGMAWQIQARIPGMVKVATSLVRSRKEARFKRDPAFSTVKMHF
jgi:hypothetical protein